LSFCWFTSFIGYPGFFKKQGNAFELGKTFITLANAALEGKSYSESKALFPNLDHAQVETKKAAFQEFGLLYVKPRSNVLSLTPAGRQVYDLLHDRNARERNRRLLLLILCQALANYQFNNPLPVGGSKGKGRAESTDILPYLASYYLLLKLDGVLTVNELRGAVFGLQAMADLRELEATIRNHRRLGEPFEQLPGLPTNERTADNLKIYFMSHLSLDGEILQRSDANFYGPNDQAFELTQFGYELIESVLDYNWRDWQRSSSPVPQAREYNDLGDYFNNGVGKVLSAEMIRTDRRRSESSVARISEGILDPYDVESLRDLPHRNFEEGRKRLITHARLETVRNSALVREAKRLFKRIHGRLFCEVCAFDFEGKYGRRGKDYIEAHHRTPISELEGPIEITAADLAMVCSNCHRMLHRPPWITIAELMNAIANEVQR
jgi:hypothetical protein